MAPSPIWYEDIANPSEHAKVTAPTIKGTLIRSFSVDSLSAFLMSLSITFLQNLFTLAVFTARTKMKMANLLEFDRFCRSKVIFLIFSPKVPMVGSP
jgi:hypothetical protein